MNSDVFFSLDKGFKFALMEKIKYPNLLYRLLLAWCGLMLLSQTPVTAQDPQFSQFYAAPLYLNPAFAA